MDPDAQFAYEHADQWRGCLHCRKSHHETSFCSRCGRCFFAAADFGGLEMDAWYGTFVHCACGQSSLWD